MVKSIFFNMVEFCWIVSSIHGGAMYGLRTVLVIDLQRVNSDAVEEHSTSTHIMYTQSEDFSHYYIVLCRDNIQ